MTAPSFMDLALKAAETAGKSAEVPIGCVIVLNNEVIAAAGNRTLTDRDPTAHAEILAILARCVSFLVAEFPVLETSSRTRVAVTIWPVSTRRVRALVAAVFARPE